MCILKLSAGLHTAGLGPFLDIIVSILHTAGYRPLDFSSLFGMLPSALYSILHVKLPKHVAT